MNERLARFLALADRTNAGAFVVTIRVAAS